MAQEYPGTDYMKMSPGEQDSGVHQDVHLEGDHKKKSPMSKVKDKAKKLRTKIKDATKKKKKDEHGNEVDATSSSSGDEQESPAHEQQHAGLTPESQKEGVVHGGAEYGSRDHPGTEKTGLLAGGMHGKEDSSAPPSGAGWPGSHDEPRAATDRAPSSDETTKRQHGVPSALGQESAGVSSGLFGSAGQGHSRDQNEYGRDQTRGAFGGGSEDKVPEGILQPKPASRDENPADSGNYGGVNQDYSRGNDSSSVAAGDLMGSSDEKVPENVMKPKSVSEGVDSSGRDLVSSEVEGDRSAFDETSGKISGDESATGQPKGWMQRATEGVTSVKNVFTSKLSSPRSAPTTPTTPGFESENTVGTDQGTQGKSWTDKARETAVGVKDTISSKLPSSTAPQDVPVTERAVDSTVNTEQKAADKTSNITTRAMETATGLKDTVASKLGYGQQGTTTTTQPSESVGSEVDTTTKPGVTQKMVGMKDAVVSKLGYGASPTGTESETTGTTGEGPRRFAPDEHDTALSQKITDMLTLGGGKTNSPTATSSPASQDTSMTDATSSPGKGGVMDKVSGVMGSLLGKKTPDDKSATGTADPNLATKDTAMTEQAS